MIVMLSLSAAAACWAASSPCHVGDRLQVLWDDALVDTARTTARTELHHPVFDGVALVLTNAWDNGGGCYRNILHDGGKYRMYYGASAIGRTNSAVVCVAESKDGIRWTKPSLGLRAFDGSTANNIVVDTAMFPGLDNFYVFRDTNPACPPDERYKGVAARELHVPLDTPQPPGSYMLKLDRLGYAVVFELWFYFSEDGYRFRPGRPILREGLFDSYNIVFWDASKSEYVCYFRGYHLRGEPNVEHRWTDWRDLWQGLKGERHIRDIRRTVSKDGRVWSKPELIVYGEGVPDYAMYTNGILPYPREPSLYVGIATRYNERGGGWTPNFDRLPFAARRRGYLANSPRTGLNISDNVFMFSRDGRAFHRVDDAFMTPGPEARRNWCYGDCYASVGFFPVAGLEGADDRLGLITNVGHQSGEPMAFHRYVIRKDGFISRYAPYAGAKLVTRPLVFTGSRMLLNFSTSGRGSLRVTVRDARGAELKSVELFGDRVDREVDFERDALASFAGRPVTLEFEMRDAHVYSFRFVSDGVANASAVRFDAAVTDGRGGSFDVSLGGATLSVEGCDFIVRGCGERKKSSSHRWVRSRLYNRYVLAVENGEFYCWVNGRKLPTGKIDQPTSDGVAFEKHKSTVLVKNLEEVKGPMPASWVSRNTVVNGGFEQLFNGFPIGWSTETFGTGDPRDIADRKGFRDRFRVDGGAYEGTRCMRVENAKGCRVHPLAECWSAREPDADYVLSVYLKAAKKGAKVKASVLESYCPIATAEFALDTDWRRYTLPAHTKTGQNLRTFFRLADEEGVFWADAVQFELGKTATAFDTRVFHDLDYPDDGDLPAVLDHYLVGDYPDKQKNRPVASKRVNARRNSFLAKNGEEVFPFGYCLVSPFSGLEANAKMLDTFRELGFNFVEYSYECLPKTEAEMRDMLDQAAARGLYVGLYLGYDAKTGRVRADHLKYAVAVKDHPALLMVGLYDEVWGNKTVAAVKKEETERVRKLLDGVPIRYNEFDAGVVTHDDFSAADVASCDIYYPGNEDVSCQYHLVRELRGDNPDRVVMFFAMANGHFTGDWMRDPTKDEVVAQAYAGFSQEVFNELWWIGVPLTDPPVEGLRQVAGEIRAIDFARFLDGAKAAVSCSSPADSVKFTAREGNGVLTVIAYNASPRAFTAAWKLPAGFARGEVLFEQRGVDVVNGAFKDAFAPNARHVYRFKCARDN